MGEGEQAEDYHQVALEIRKTQVGPIMLRVQLRTTSLVLCTVSWAHWNRQRIIVNKHCEFGKRN